MWQYNSENKSLAQNNRRQRTSTQQEGILWHTFLKTCPIHFYRQYRIDNYIVDFYAPKAKLAIELDGSQHYEEKNENHEKNRTQTLEEHGITVLRFTNYEIDRYLRRTTEQIVYVLEQKLGKSIY